ETQGRACQHRHRHHQAFLARIQMQVGRNQHRQRTQQHPDREADVEIKEAGYQGWQMARLEESGLHGTLAGTCGRRRRVTLMTMPNAVIRKCETAYFDLKKVKFFV